MSDDLVPVHTFNRRHEAEFAQGFLEDAGIDSVLSADDAGGADIGLSFARQVRLLVRPGEREEAEEVLREAGVLDG